MKSTEIETKELFQGGHMADDMAGDRPEVEPYLKLSIDHARIWSGAEPTAESHDPKTILQIAPVRKLLMAQPLSLALERTYEGVFFPALLLCSGWWERDRRATLADEVDWRSDLQHWLFSGFEQWGRRGMSTRPRWLQTSTSLAKWARGMNLSRCQLPSRGQKRTTFLRSWPKATRLSPFKPLGHYAIVIIFETSMTCGHRYFNGARASTFV